MIRSSIPAVRQTGAIGAGMVSPFRNRPAIRKNTLIIIMIRPAILQLFLLMRSPPLAGSNGSCPPAAYSCDNSGLLTASIPHGFRTQ